MFRGLKELRNPISLRAALAAIEDDDSGVRVQAVGVIGYLKAEEALPALIVATRDDAAEVRRAAVGALAFSRSSHASDALMAGLERPGMAGARDRGRDHG